MKFKQVNDEEISDFIMNDPNLIYLGITDQEMVFMLENKKYIPSPGSYYIGITDDDNQLVSILKWELFTVDVISVHFYVASKYHKTGISLKIWDFVHNHLLDNTTIRKVIVFVPEPCEHVIKCTERNGFKKEGAISNACSWRKEIKSIFIYGLDIIREDK